MRSAARFSEQIMTSTLTSICEGSYGLNLSDLETVRKACGYPCDPYTGSDVWSYSCFMFTHPWAKVILDRH